ncbi:MAG: hypothetical protein AAB584_01165 [Patescibacteria group bacterium]
MTDVRKNLIIIIFLLTGAVIILLFLNLNSSWEKQRAEILDSYSAPANLPKRISRGPVNFFEPQGSKVIFYEESDSTIYEAGLDGKNKKELARIPGVTKIVFSPSGYELVATVSEKNTLKNYYFDLKNSKRAELPKDAEDIVFSPDARKIAYYFYNAKIGEGNILIANPDGSDSKTIFRTRIKNPILIWSQNNLIVFYLKEEDNQSLAFSVRPDGKGFQRLTEEELALYTSREIDEISAFKELGIKTAAVKISLLKDNLIFLNAKDGKLYSLGF